MRISDWSSDVCSSDLEARTCRADEAPHQQNGEVAGCAAHARADVRRDKIAEYFRLIVARRHEAAPAQPSCPLPNVLEREILIGESAQQFGHRPGNQEAADARSCQTDRNSTDHTPDW